MAIQLRMPKNSPSVHFSSDILKIFDANRGRAEKGRACPERRGVASNGWCTPRTIKTKTNRYQRHRTRLPLQSPRCTGGGGGFSYFPPSSTTTTRRHAAIHPILWPSNSTLGVLDVRVSPKSQHMDTNMLPRINKWLLRRIIISCNFCRHGYTFGAH